MVMITHRQGQVIHTTLSPKVLEGCESTGSSKEELPAQCANAIMQIPAPSCDLTLTVKWEQLIIIGLKLGYS